ncbi:hypothetical protein PGT21_007240 [Puccinia graminis f. sp. tritici]|uniref:Uncharacterized protein n=1 Tax=Puccinia graminis f. sp. tritici TaxID=56615 RepID=A0A5B0QEM8_PUCGR|nr:hypothetical protein PGT21_007240 [Puccinia graminis f. sp. tritici]
MKRTAPDHEVIDIDEIDSEQQDSQSGANKRSFAWTHFKDKPGTMEAVCQVVTKSGAICGRSIERTRAQAQNHFTPTCQASIEYPTHISPRKPNGPPERNRFQDYL